MRIGSSDEIRVAQHLLQRRLRVEHVQNRLFELLPVFLVADTHIKTAIERHRPIHGAHTERNRRIDPKLQIQQDERPETDTLPESRKWHTHLSSACN